MNHLDALRRNLDLYFTQYEHVILLGEFNVKSKEPCLQAFRKIYGLKNLTATTTCYKNPEKPSSVDLTLTISWSNFQCSCVIETNLSDFHQTVTVMKLKPKLTYYINYKMYSNDKFREELLSKLSKENINNTRSGLEKFLQITIIILYKLAHQKKTYIRGNKPLTPGHRKRNHVRNRFLKNRCLVNRIKCIKQRNYCVSLLRKTKRKYYA